MSWLITTLCNAALLTAAVFLGATYRLPFFVFAADLAACLDAEDLAF